MNALAHTVLDTIKIIETREVGRESYETCATARASYNEDTRELSVDLDAFVRHFEMRGKDEVLGPPWLPRKDSVRTHTDRDEASEAAKEIFQNWAEKVRKTIPGSEEWNTHPGWLEKKS
jgi:hypothetical protein